MAIRIIAGKYRQREIAAPVGMDTRPTLGRTRESLFSILFGKIEDKKVLDLFAGSGALGFEALSRGAASCVFCDKAPQAIRALENNVRLLKAENETRILRDDWHKSLRLLHEEGLRFDLVFLDPPYCMDINEVLQTLWDYRLLAERGIIVAEHGADKEAAGIGDYAVYSRRQYRDTILTFLERREDDEESAVSGQL